MTKPQYFIEGSQAQQLYSRAQSLGQGTSQGVGVAASITYPSFMQFLHVAPGTTARVDYRGTGPSDFDRAEVTFLTDNPANRSAISTLESFAGISLTEVKETSREGVPMGAEA